jgi:hypothetical protein
MDVRLWGPQFWSTMDFVAFNYPHEPTETDKKNVRTFYETLALLLPCSSCRNDFAKMLKTFPIDEHLQNQESLTKWLVEAHNRVNEKLGKSRIDYETVANKYNQMRGTCEMRRTGSSTCPPQASTSSSQKKCISRTVTIATISVAIVVLISVMAWWVLHVRKRIQ